MSVPSVSADGKKIAYSDHRGIVVMNNDGSNAKLILTDLGEGAVPHLSPDGKRIVYQKTKDDGHYILESDIFIINSDGTGEQRLTNSGKRFAAEPSWSADGKKIVFFYRNSPANQIAILEID